jgi:ABC-2 type transport system permease protein
VKYPNLIALLATVRKEWLLLRRDVHGLVLLFLMPVAFILIMSLALQNQFAQRTGSKIEVLVDDQAHNDASQTVLAQLQQREAFAWLLQTTETNEVLQQRVAHDTAAALLTLTPANGVLQAAILVAPTTSQQTEAILEATVGEAISRQRIETLLREQKLKRAYSGDAFSLDDNEEALEKLSANPVQVDHSYRPAEGKAPTSVQQSVPAWLVFAMFFAVVPLSNALISERQQGTLRRLRTLPISPFLPVIGKLIPYFFINQIQVILMLLVGVYVMPLLGADRLTLGDSLAGLALMAVSLSIAALGYGILIAAVARTTDQATTLGGTGNILLAAIGGIMVPRFVMPEAMQQLSNISPMAWGLEGFLDIFLRNGGVVDVLPEAGALFLFGVVTIALALVSSRKQT